MAEIYEVVITAVITSIGLLTAWFVLPERIKMLPRFPSDAEHLFWEVQSLVSSKDGLRDKVDNLLSDKSKVENRIATDWFETVDKLLDSIIRDDESLKKRFDTMKSTWDCLIGIRRYYRLATDVSDSSVKVKKIIEMRNNFKEEDLITDVPEFLRLIRTLGEKVKSVKKVVKILRRTERDLEKRIKALENDGRQRHCRVSDWFGETQECLCSFDQAFPYYKSVIETPCQLTNFLVCQITSSASSSSYSCSSKDNACVACRNKYALSKEVKGLIDLYEDLDGKGSRYLDNVQDCVGPVLELLVVLRKLEANCISLESLKTNLEKMKHDIEERVCSTVESFQQSGMEIECSSEVRRWLIDVESVITSSSVASHKWQNIQL